MHGKLEFDRLIRINMNGQETCSGWDISNFRSILRDHGIAIAGHALWPVQSPAYEFLPFGEAHSRNSAAARIRISPRTGPNFSINVNIKNRPIQIAEENDIKLHHLRPPFASRHRYRTPQKKKQHTSSTHIAYHSLNPGPSAKHVRYASAPFSNPDFVVAVGRSLSSPTRANSLNSPL